MLTTLKPGFYLGIDGGGTKTEAVIATESGFEIGRGLSAGSNPHNVSLDVAFENIRSAVHAAKQEAEKKGKHVKLDEVDAVCIGLAGLDTQADRNRITTYLHNVPPDKKIYHSKKVILCNDGFIGLKSAADENWGVCLIASTGSNCYGVNQAGMEAAAGGWGYLLGDLGSGYHLGMKILHRVIQEYDGRQPQTSLTPVVLKQLGLEHASDLISWAYRSQVPVKDIAALTQVLNDPSLKNSIDLYELVASTQKDLLSSYRTVVHRLQLKGKAFPVVLIGGLFKLTMPFKETITQWIKEYTPTARIISSRRSSAEGAVKIALMANFQKLFPDSVITIVDPKNHF